MRKIATILLAFFLTQAAQAQTFPTRPITVVVPFPAGGPSDVVARIVAEQMGKNLGQPMVIENVTGAGGTLGSGRVAAARPDGYTILAGSMGSHVSAPVLTPSIKYNPARDFEPIGVSAHAPAVITARKDFPAKDLRGFVAYLRSNGEQVRQAHGGIGSSSHMACLLFTAAIGVNPTLIAYRGVDQAVTNLIGGHVDFFCDAAVTAASHITDGTLRGYGVSGSERLLVLPDLPTATEAGINYQMSIWAGMFAPKGTPGDVVARLAQALDRALDEPTVSKRLNGLGASIPPKAERTPAAFATFVNAEITRWSPILQAAGNVEAK